jgi:hypothetical protein
VWSQRQAPPFKSLAPKQPSPVSTPVPTPLHHTTMHHFNVQNRNGRRSSLLAVSGSNSLRDLMDKAKNSGLVRRALRLLSISVDYNHLVS